MPSVDERPGVFRAATLKEAYRRVKHVLGDDAVILGSRKVTQRQALGLGQEQIVEVMAGPAGTRMDRPRWSDVAEPRSTRQETVTPGGMPAQLVKDVEHIESLVKAIEEDFQARQERAGLVQGNPLAETLIEAGVRPTTMEKLLTRFTSETGKSARDRVAALGWLTDSLRASNCDWDGFYGCHAFLGRPGSGRTSLVLEAAGRLRKLGRRTLVLLVMPENKADVRRLQTAASEMGFDGAVIQQPNQLSRSDEHLGRYEAVLVDMPSLGHPAMAPGGVLHTWLASNPGFHRHLVLPLESDPMEMSGLADAIRDWHMDWLAPSRTDLSQLTGKYLEFQDALPLPYSLVSRRGPDGLNIEIASSEKLVDSMLGTEKKEEARA